MSYEPTPKRTRRTPLRFEELVPLAALRLGREGYGLSVAKEIERLAERAVARASVYVRLGRLERKGFIST